MPTAIDPATFVSAVRPYLERQDLDGLLQLINAKWDAAELAELLGGADPDARKVAVAALALVGDRANVDGIAAQLVDPDPLVNHLAEYAIWLIWFRLGTPKANAAVGRGSQALGQRATERAIELFDAAIAAAPDFAEAYNQRAIARFMLDQFAESIADCRRAVRLMPCHFGAWAGMGHCFLHEGQLADALRCYDRALAINPHLDQVRQAADGIRRELVDAA